MTLLFGYIFPDSNRKLCKIVAAVTCPRLWQVKPLKSCSVCKRWLRCVLDVDGESESAFRKFLEPIRPMISFVLGSVYSCGKKSLSAGWCFEILPFLVKS